MSKTDSIAVPPLLRRLKPAGRKKKDLAAKDSTSGKAVIDSVLSGNTHRTDLLHWTAPKPFSLTDVRFRDEGYFKGNPYFHPEQGIAHNGVLGDPAPYSVSNDNTVAGTLLVCFALAMIAASMSSNFIVRQIKSLFHMPHRRTMVSETAYEVRFQLFLVLQTALLFSITYYLYTRSLTGGAYILDSQLAIVGIYLAVFLCYFLIKYLLYSLVNWVYFDRKSNSQWTRLCLFLTSAEGVLTFPVVLLLIYFHLSVHYTLIYVVSVIAIIKILTFYQGFVIFFRRTAAGLQIILYFCALELMPLTALLGILTYTGNYLTINY